jgi:CheY-like chemotaxis protein
MPVNSQKGLVIYADDDPDDLFLVSEGLLAYAPNIDLIMVRDGFELLSCLNTLKHRGSFPCLIILDINMPRMDGKSALRHLRSMKEYAETPIVLFSTSTAPSDEAFAFQYNAGFVPKPGSFTDLNPIIEAFFSQCSEEVHRLARMAV